jgi:hypothetical protein
MTIRFLQTVPSQNAEFPFQAGQIITVTAPSDFILSLVDGVRAEVLRVDTTERAVAPAVTTPEPTLTKRRRRSRVTKH